MEMEEQQALALLLNLFVVVVKHRDVLLASG